ncbi:expressed protein [Arabidopsis lyrata subsp. lyrata]|uniref:Expressed protein n=1 Tax=Arabidopsis lyrata subsp. lyrata TaxID=81972 RepID=D7M4X6_ARALL|nr:expressed protein [Arabidopsis lyrata subsp. lyrata]
MGFIFTAKNDDNTISVEESGNDFHKEDVIFSLPASEDEVFAGGRTEINRRFVTVDENLGYSSI